MPINFRSSQSLLDIATLPSADRLTGVEQIPVAQGGTTKRTPVSALRISPVFSVVDFGADPTGVVDCVPAITAAISAAIPVSGDVYFPLGRFKVGATIQIEDAWSVILRGASSLGTVIDPTSALNAAPVFRFKNCQRSGVESMEIEGAGISTSTTSIAIEFLVDNPIAVHPTGCYVDQVLFSYRSGYMEKGIRWTAALGWDQNNDVSTIRDCVFGYSVKTAFSIEHSNSLLHRAVRCTFLGTNVAVLAGGSITLDGCNLAIGSSGDTTGWIFDMQAGSYFHPSVVLDCAAESNSRWFRSVAGASSAIIIVNGGAIGGGGVAGPRTVIDWQTTSADSYVEFQGVKATIGQPNQIAEFASANSVARFIGCPELPINEYRYNGHLLLVCNKHVTGTVLTNLGSGELTQLGEQGGTIDGSFIWRGVELQRGGANYLKLRADLELAGAAIGGGGGLVFSSPSGANIVSTVGPIYFDSAPTTQIVFRPGGSEIFRVGAYGILLGFDVFIAHTGAGEATLTGDIKFNGKMGFYNTAPVVKPAVSGSRGGNAALTSALTALAGLGLITDSSSA